MIVFNLFVAFCNKETLSKTILIENKIPTNINIETFDLNSFPAINFIKKSPKTETIITTKEKKVIVIHTDFFSKLQHQS